MQISCERCSTSYVLDDALIPAQGAPVQCTRCGLVFTARPPTAAASPRPASAPPPAGSNSTMVFGKTPPPAAGTSTAMFGAVGEPKPNQTLMFGASAKPPTPAPANGGSTALFGALKDAPAAANPRSTQMFGALGQMPGQQPSSAMQMLSGAREPAPAPAAPSPSSTMMFGAVKEPARPAAPSTNSTLMFGAAKEPAPAAPSPSSTMMFGAVKTPAPVPAAPSPSSTMMFGAVKTPAPVPAAPSPSSTMMFGAVKEPAPVPAAPSPSSTMMFGAVKEPAPMPTAPSPSSTMMFGAPAEPRAAAPAWQAPPPVDPTFSPQPTAQPASTAPAAPLPLTQPKRAITGPVSLSGAPVPFPQSFAPEVDDDPYARQLAGRSRRVGTIVVFLVLAAMGGGFAYWYTSRPAPPPPELVARATAAFHDVEVDTVASLQSAEAELQKVAAASPPQFVAVPKADALVVLAFQAADLREQVTALESQNQQLEKAYKKADSDHSRADWRTVVENVRHEIDALKKQHDPLVEQAAKLDDQQSALLKELGELRNKVSPAPPEIDRAIAVYYGFKGSESASRFAQAYRGRGLNDGWADLALAAYADQPKQTADTYHSGLASAQAALRANPRLTRAKRIEADLQLALHQFEAARATANELALELPDDARVKRLLVDIQAAEKSAPPTNP